MSSDRTSRTSVYIAKYIADILVIDDKPDNLRLLSIMLAEQGYKVRKAISGLMALTAVETARPDLILLDINMPYMNGYEVCQHLKASEATRDIPIVFLSALDDVFDKVKAFQLGGADYITKPYKVEEVIVRVENQLKIVKLQQELKKQNERLKKANLELQRLANLDGLTQLANRRRFDEYLKAEWERMARQQLPLSAIICDLDYFKRYNDTYGHLLGDDCLRAVARAISLAVKKPENLLARYGGEELAAILPNTQAEEATLVAEAIRLQIQGLKIVHAESTASKYVTASMGVASIVPKPELSPEILVALADKALYQAKRQGRDRYCLKTL